MVATAQLKLDTHIHVLSLLLLKLAILTSLIYVYICILGDWKNPERRNNPDQPEQHYFLRILSHALLLALYATTILIIYTLYHLDFCYAYSVDAEQLALLLKINLHIDIYLSQ